jgi:hypothetical protein
MGVYEQCKKGVNAVFGGSLKGDWVSCAAKMGSKCSF